jgi:hypothetical protein
MVAYLAALIFRRISRLCRASVHKDLRLGDLCKELGFSVRTRVIRDGALVGSDLRADRALDGGRLGDATLPV